MTEASIGMSDVWFVEPDVMAPAAWSFAWSDRII